MSSLSLKKQEELNAKRLKELLLLPENKKCFDCPTKSPFFVNISIQTFVCARCSGLVREVGHRVKSISASKFSDPEIVALEYGGNEVARSIWLSTYRTNTPEPETDNDVRLFMRQKYYEQKWLDRQKVISHAEKVKAILTETFSQDGSRRASMSSTKAQLSPTSPKQKIDITLKKPVMTPSKSWVDDNVPIGLIPTVNSLISEKNYDNNLLIDNKLSDTLTSQPQRSSIASFNSLPLGQGLVPLPSSNNVSNTNQLSIKIPNPIQTSTPTKSNVYSDLAELNPIKPIKTSSYVGGILKPNSSSSPAISALLSPTMSPISISSPVNPKSNYSNDNNKIDLDPYAALRNLSISSKPTTPSNNASSSNNSSSVFFGGFNPPSRSKENNRSFNSLFGDLDPLSK